MKRLFLVGVVHLALATLMGGAGCFRETHLVGDGVFANDAGAQTQGSDADGPARLDTNAAPPPVDALDPAGGQTVTSIGDQASLGWPLVISANDVASRLSMFLFQAPASTQLVQAIVARAPKTNQDVGQLADGLLLSAQSAEGMHAFYSHWLDLAAFTQPNIRDAMQFPAFTPAVASELVKEALLFADDVTWQPDGDLASLLSKPSAFVTSTTAPWFPAVSLPPGTTAPREVALDPVSYGGIFSQPAVVAVHDYATRISPSMRGFSVRTRLMCQLVPPEPQPSPSALSDPSVTIRQEISNIVSPPVCRACHQVVEPLGFAWEHFNAVGAFTAFDRGGPADSSGELASFNDSGSAVAFNGAGDFATKLVTWSSFTTVVEPCFAAQWLAFATGRYADGGAVLDDQAAASDVSYIVQRATVRGHLNLRGVIRAVTETQLFLAP